MTVSSLELNNDSKEEIIKFNYIENIYLILIYLLNILISFIENKENLLTFFPNKTLF